LADAEQELEGARGDVLGATEDADLKEQLQSRQSLMQRLERAVLIGEAPFESVSHALV
jgi:hypothetical protein